MDALSKQEVAQNVIDYYVTVRVEDESRLELDVFTLIMSWA